MVRERAQREAMESRMKQEKELLEDVLHREMNRASALQAELLQAQQAKVSSCQQRCLLSRSLSVLQTPPSVPGKLE